MGKIKGGYVLQPRIIQNSEIAHSPPHIREIWMWLIRKANHSRKKTHGRWIERGQCFTSYNEIIDALSWKVGYRTQRYKKSECDYSMRFLRSRSMITTQKTTRGLVITICNYNSYQNPKNYELDNDYDNDYDNCIQQHDTINKNVKNVNKRKKIIVSNFPVEAENLYNYFVSTFDDSEKRFIPTTEKQKYEWLDCIEKCNKIDKYSYEQIHDMIEYVRDPEWNDFWHKNFFTPLKFRRKNREGIKYIDYIWNQIKEEVEYGKNN